MFDPKTNKFPYPLDTASHYLPVNKDNGNVYDGSYPFVNTKKSFAFKRFLMRCCLFIFVFLVARIRTGLKIEGRKNIRKHRAEIKKGVVSVCNHVHMWDYICIMRAALRKTHILTWDKNISGPNGTLIRLNGGIPVPVGSTDGTTKMMLSTIKMIKNRGWLHVAAEASMWEYYAPIRPFKTGAAYFAYKSDRPILPLAFTYRPCGFIRKKIFKQVAKLTLHVGEPIYANKELEQKESIVDLTKRVHAEICRLAGFKKGENIYAPLYERDVSKRIDYYTSEYGAGYKGSW